MPAKPPVEDLDDVNVERVRRVDARRNLEAIVEAAIPLLTERPRASMQQIAAAAGLHRATVHRHFPSRDDLLDELRRRATVATAAELEMVLERPSGDPADTLERATAAMLAVGDHYRLYRFTTWRSEETASLTGVIRARLLELIGRARDAGQVRSDIPVERLGVIYSGLVVAVLPAIGDGALTAAQAARTIRALVASPGT